MIYLDNAATTRPDRDSVQRALRFLENDFFNPSALYKEGFDIHKEFESARKSLLSHIADSASFEFLFTSCGSESDNQVLFSCARRGNFVTTEGEHAAIYNAATELKKRGIDVRFARLNADGSVNEEDLLRQIDGNTSLVSVIHVNNETGAINDIAKLASLAKLKNPDLAFHSDGVQAFGKIPFRLTKEIDFYTVSAHKIGGIRGIAGLVRGKRRTLYPLIYGGGQEGGLRGGTENVFAAKQFEYAAVYKFSALERDFEKVKRFNESFRIGLDKTVFRILSADTASPYILSIAAPGLRGETLQHMIDDHGVIVGTGSACSSRNRFSRVILACVADENTADGVLRISFSAENTESEIAESIRIINSCTRTLADKMK